MNIKDLEPYIIPPSPFDEQFVKDLYDNEGIDITFLELLRNIDYNRNITTGVKVVQTVGHTYKSDIAKLLYFVETYVDSKDKETFISKILEAHNKLLMYEEENPPIVYQKKASKSSRRVNSKTPVEKKEKKSKESAASRKLALKAAKLNTLKFNFKPSN